jgi:hypothetical protein
MFNVVLHGDGLVQVPHPLYRPTKNKLVPCVDQMCAALHGGLTGRHKCDSPKQQCDYEIKYADQGSSLGVLVTDSFALRLANSSIVRPGLAFGYATCNWLDITLEDDKNWPLDVVLDGGLFVCAGVGMISRLGAALRCQLLMVSLGLGVALSACFHSSSSMGSLRTWLATASVQEVEGSSSLVMTLCLTRVQRGLLWLVAHPGEPYYPWTSFWSDKHGLGAQCLFATMLK